jgi:serine protease Do
VHEAILLCAPVPRVLSACHFLQTDAAINQGNSGGALVNTRAELIGINSQIIAPNGGGSVGIGFAIPSNMAKFVADELISEHEVRRGSLGVTVQAVTSDIASSLGLSQVRGVLVSSVAHAGPAAQAGVNSGDVILQVNGADVSGPNGLRNEIASLGPGADAALTIWRNGQQRQIHVKLAALRQTGAPGQNQNESGSENGSKSNRLGITVQPLTPDLAPRLGLNASAQGVAITSVDPDSPAAQARLQAGDVIQEANRQPVRTPDDLRKALASSGNRPLLLLVNRQGQTLYIAMPLQQPQPSGALHIFYKSAITPFCHVLRIELEQIRYTTDGRHNKLPPRLEPYGFNNSKRRNRGLPASKHRLPPQLL